MSGRLVILPHKQWHVWNKDNREKVKRDERLNKEEQERDRLRDSSLQQEINLAQLKANCEGTERRPEGEGVVRRDVAAASLIPFTLFSNVDEDLRQKEVRDERARVQKQKDLQLKRREGVAEWGLGEGSSEHSKIIPWYLKVKKDNTNVVFPALPAVAAATAHPSSSSAVLADEGESAARRRDRLRQEREDPILKFMKPKAKSAPGDRYISTEERVRVAVELSSKRAREEEGCGERCFENSRKKQKKGKKEWKKEKKHKEKGEKK